jgi:hypothetical protein
VSGKMRVVRRCTREGVAHALRSSRDVLLPVSTSLWKMTSGPNRYLARFFAIAGVSLILAFPVLSQGSQEPHNNSQGQKNLPQQKTKNKNDRMFYVMANNLTVEDERQIEPISWKQKFSITAKNAFDPYTFAGVGILAGIRQAENAYPAFEQEMSGSGKRYTSLMGWMEILDCHALVSAL